VCVFVCFYVCVFVCVCGRCVVCDVQCVYGRLPSACTVKLSLTPYLRPQVVTAGDRGCGSRCGSGYITSPLFLLPLLPVTAV